MNQQDFIEKISPKLKLIRNEFDYTQETMAKSLGISKKTLVQIEKGRSLMKWSEAVTLAILFNQSEIVQMAFGGSAQEIIMTISFDDYQTRSRKTMGGKVWWKDLEKKCGFRIQQNIISQHYRLLDPSDYRILSSFDRDTIYRKLSDIIEKNQ